jgi:hypothetical protein
MQVRSARWVQQAYRQRQGSQRVFSRRAGQQRGSRPRLHGLLAGGSLLAVARHKLADVGQGAAHGGVSRGQHEVVHLLQQAPVGRDLPSEVVARDGHGGEGGEGGARGAPGGRQRPAQQVVPHIQLGQGGQAAVDGAPGVGQRARQAVVGQRAAGRERAGREEGCEGGDAG